MLLTTAVRQNAVRFFETAMTHLAGGDPAAALADLDRAIELDPSYADAYANRGSIRHLLGDYSAALADLDRAIDLDPGLASAYNNRGAVRLMQWDLDRAIADFDAALALDPSLHQAYLSRANARYHKRDLDAEADFREAFRLNPAYTATAIIAQMVWWMNHNAQAVLADCEKHLRWNPGDFHSLARRGLLFVLQSRDSAAEPDFQAYRRLNPAGAPLLDLLIAEAQRQRLQLGAVSPANLTHVTDGGQMVGISWCAPTGAEQEQEVS